MGEWWLATDCEGPLTLNDYAFELCAAYIPAGDRLFQVLSRYDDYLVAVERRPGHAAGSTLRWVAPFLKAFGLTEAEARAFAARHLLVLPGVGDVLPRLKEVLPTFIISASYQPYVEALCRTVGFPEEQTWSTPFPLDAHTLPAGEAERLKKLAATIGALAPPTWPAGAAGPADLEKGEQKTVALLAAAVAELEAGESSALVEAVTVVGGAVKAQALKEIATRLGRDLATAIYFGDSITDAEALSLVRRAGGMAVAFNANRYALAEGEIACLSPHAAAMLALALAFAQGGPQAVRHLAAAWRGWESVAALSPEEGYRPGEEVWRAVEMFALKAPLDPELIARSEAFRRQVRGEAIGALG